MTFSTLHPHAIEEAEFAFSRLYPDHDGEARAMGHCCAQFARGADCRHTMSWEDCYPSPDEMVAMGWTPDGAGQWVEPGDLCSVDGRPVPPY